MNRLSLSKTLHPKPAEVPAKQPRRRNQAKFRFNILPAIAGILLISFAIPRAAALQPSAPGDWIWFDGSSTVGSACVSTYPCGQTGVYGTKGTIASGNTPGSRTDAMSWTDTSGRKWLFGGFGYGAGGGLGEQNDLWQSGASGNTWGWMSGSNGPGHSGAYGTLGTPAASNVPGGREGAVTWTDKSGNLWLFGGFGYDGNTTSNYGYENDLWMYNPTTNQWTWESGSSTVPAPTSTIYGTFIGAASGVYGTLGTPAAGNTPSGRTNATAWTDSNGNLWLFGGGAVNELGYEDVYNDLWEFNTNTKLWTWVAGGNTLDELGVYGTFQTPASGNAPGARYLASGWTDSSGNFWLFGGSGYASNAGEFNLNDLWKFSTSTSQWTWMGGASILYPCNILFSTPCPVPGTYGTLGTAASTNFPGARNASATWTDSSGNLWLFGGSGQDANSFGAWLNDLWEYNPGTTEWTWMGGSSTIPASCATGNCGRPGVYGSPGTAASTSVPGARQTAVSWADQSGNFWLFGGWGVDANGATGYLNDMWEYQPPSASTTPQAATPTFSESGGTYSSTQTVSISDTTPGATIYYTINGTTPTAGSSVYGGAITVSSTETIEAIAVASGYTTSATASATYTISPPAATPTFSVPAGTYSSPQTVTIGDSTPGATIYYTTNGTSPATSPLTYGGPITVSSTETLEALATASGYTTSAVATATYTINLPAAAAPTFSVPGGTYSSTQNVTISDTTPGATIYYTTNGSTPTTSSAVYSGAITISSTETLEAIATASGYTTSSVATAAYTINLAAAATPTFSVPGGTYSSAQSVTISDTTPGATIYYTTNGSTPTTSSSVYSGAISVSSSETLEAIATASGYSTSAVATAAYTISSAAATPTFSVPGGTYSSAQNVTISDTTPGATIYYTTNGSTPTTSSAVYSGAITVSSTETLKAIATASGYTTSSVATAAYTINLAAAATPTFSVPGGTYSSAQSVTISDTTPGATIYYTTNGTTPTTSSSVYSGAISVSSSETLEAIATASGYSTSAVATAAYTISATVQITVGASPAGLSFSVDGTPYTSTQTLSWTAGSSHTIATASPQTNGGTQNTFASWSDAGAISHSVTAPSTATTYTAAFSTSYQLTTSANPSTDGTVTPPSGTYYASGTVVNLTATPNSGDSFTSWTGSVASAGSASTTVTMNAPQTVTANFSAVVAAAPVASLTPPSLSFTSATGVASAPQIATLSNTGNATLTIAGITIAGANPTDFAVGTGTNACGSSLAASSTCSIYVTFTPASATGFSATLTVADNASGSPQTTTLTGTGTSAPTFAISSSTTAQTIQPGGAATYSITAAAQNGSFPNVITLAASGLPPGATATFAPTSITPGSSSATSTLTIQTAKQTASLSTKESPWPFAAPALALIGFFFLPGKRRRRWISLAILLLASLGTFTALTACGGGFGMNSATLAKNYTITITGTSGTVQQTATVLLTVE